ncbi:hypothetical protein C4F49_01595 [Sphingobacterium sp. KB22]|uniref:Uncharacterized protein n=1 Tax=Sphingobacterium hungaricum TaxID=2082723 RepID=A0A928USH4_9SPHI|nr:hypothetical protein [Sphingobacterium hungaricum]
MASLMTKRLFKKIEMQKFYIKFLTFKSKVRTFKLDLELTKFVIGYWHDPINSIGTKSIYKFISLFYSANILYINDGPL